MSDDRKQQLAQLDEAGKRRDEAVARFFDGTLAESERLAAGRGAGTFRKEEVARALEVVDDGTQPPAIRAMGLNGLGNQATHSESLLSHFIEILSEPKNPSDLRLVALTKLQAAQFGSPVMVGLRPKYMAALRQLVDDDDARLRRAALENLALLRDDYVQRRLLEGLKAPAQALVEPEVAIQLLANDLHADAVPTLREIAKNPPNAAAKKEALRNLASDAASAPLLESTLRDTSEAPETRHVSAIALHQTKPELATAIMRELATSATTDESLKTAFVNSLVHLDPKLGNDLEEAARSGLESEESKELSRRVAEYKARFR